MKIVYYLPSLETSGGLERIIAFKANFFAEKGHEVTVITSEQRKQKCYFALLPSVKHIDLNVPFDYPYNQSKLVKLLKYPFKYFLFRKRFTKVLKQLSPDITISTLRRELNFISSIDDGSAKIGEFHITRNSYGIETIGSKTPFIRFIKQQINKRFISKLSQLNRVVLLTHEEKSFWPELSNSCVIPNPVVTLSDHTSDCTSKQVIAVGRYAPQKGFDLLIPAWKLVHAQHPGWILRIYGNGTREELQQQIDGLGITSACILEPAVTNITDKYCESSIFVLSSRYEGFGMVIIEAMDCGVPPVSFACPCGPRDIIDDRVDGLLVENGNIRQLSEKICYLIENENIRKEMGRQAHINVQRYKMEKIATQWEKLFESVIKNNQS